MTRYTITAAGNVRVDDEAILPVNVSEFPANFNALHFQTDTNTGSIGYNDGVTPSIPITTMVGIEEYLGVDLETLLARRTAKKIADAGLKAKAIADAEAEAEAGL
jgi:hypothetical protein